MNAGRGAWAGPRALRGTITPNREDKIMPDDAHLVIEPYQGETYNHPGEWAVYRYSTYPESSVLAGQTRRTFIDSSTDRAWLSRRYPDADVSESTGYTAPRVPDTAPEWFDPASAGETWSEDDL